MVGANDREVAPVDSRDLGDAQSLSSGHDGRIHGAKRQVVVARDQLGNPQPVRNRYRFHGEPAVGQVAEEADLWRRPETSREQVDDFGNDQRRDDKRAGVGLEQLECGIVMSIVSVDVGVERPSVDDKRGYRATSAARISSIRSETSRRPLRPALAAPSRRRVDGPPR